jgi:hypothetical protein
MKPAYIYLREADDALRNALLADHQLQGFGVECSDKTRVSLDHVREWINTIAHDLEKAGEVFPLREPPRHTERRANGRFRAAKGG